VRRAVLACHKNPVGGISKISRPSQVITILSASRMSAAMRAAMLWLAMIGLAAADDMKVVSSVVVLNNDNFEHLTQASTGANDFPCQ
jgi:hypothetical protein